MEEYTQLLLKIIQFQRGGDKKIWILKTPQMIETLEERSSLYSKNSKIIFTHRDGNSMIKSMVIMIIYVMRGYSTSQFNPKKIGKFWFDRFSWVSNEKLLKKNINKFISIENQYHVRYEEFMKDTLGVVMNITKFTGLPVSNEIRELYKSFIFDNPKLGSAIFEYDLESFGISNEESKIAFKFYEEEYDL